MSFFLHSFTVQPPTAALFLLLIEIPRQFLLQQFRHIIAEALYLILLMGVVPDGFLSGTEQELVAVRFFPELAQQAGRTPAPGPEA